MKLQKKKLWVRQVALGLMAGLALAIAPAVAPVHAEGEEACTAEHFTETSILGKDYNVDGTVMHGTCDDGEGGGIFEVLNIVLTVLTYGVGIAATVGFVIAGFQYLTARDNEGQVAKAKQRMLQIVIGLFLYAMLWALLNFLLPGGLFSGR